MAARPGSSRRWVILAAVVVGVVVLIGAVVALAGDGDDDGTVAEGTTEVGTDVTAPAEATDTATPSTEAPVTTEVDDTTTEAPATTERTEAPDTTEREDDGDDTTTTVDVPGGAAVGDTIALPDGARARVNTVTPNAAPRDELFGPDPGFTFTEADVELCAGGDGLSVNPLYWTAFLADNREAEVSLIDADLATFDVAPGGCTRGFVAFSVPDGSAVDDVVLTDVLLAEVGRWSTATTTPVDGPLTSDVAVRSTAVGELIDVGDGATAVVRSITPGVAPTDELLPLDPGRQLVGLDVELCAGTAPLSVNPLYWLVTGTDNYTGTASLGSGGLPTIDVAPGQCVAGTVQVDALAGSAPAYAIYTGTLFEELGRWRP